MIGYLMDANGDLLIENGDLVRGDTTRQNQMALLMAQPGEYKQYPTAGVGWLTFLKDVDDGALMRAIRQQFTQDGMTIKSLSAVNGIVNVVAPYGNS